MTKLIKIIYILIVSAFFAHTAMAQNDLYDDTSYESYDDDVISHCNLKRSLSGAGMGLVINASLTEILKHSINEMRPDFSDNSSFPSRHTSYAFTAATIAFHELGSRWAIWGPIAQSAANVVAMQRVMSQNHYPSDVLAGAALGIVSTEVGYAIADMIFDCGHAPKYFPAHNRASLQAYTSAIIPLAGHNGSGLSTGCGIESALGITMPTSTYAGTGFTVLLRDMPVYCDGLYVAMLKSLGVKSSTYLRRDFASGRWACEGDVSLGLLRNFSRPMSVAPSWSWIAELSGSLYRRFSRSFSAGLRAGYDWTNRFDTNSSVSISLITRAEF